MSVVLATYKDDGLPFLKRAIASVRAQTYPRIEVLVVADGQLPDETTAYLTSLEDQSFTFIRLATNGGPARARNAGIARARGDYIAILDADDVCAPHRIETQLTFLTETASDVVGSSYFEIDTADAIIGERTLPRSCQAIRTTCPFFNPIANPTVFAKAEVLKRNPYPEEFRLGEDYRLWVRLLSAGYVISNHEANLLHFRRREDFYRKRRGLGWAMSDMRNKLSALRLARWYLWPAVFLFALATFGLRLLPARTVGLIYRVRHRWLTAH